MPRLAWPMTSNQEPGNWDRVRELVPIFLTPRSWPEGCSGSYTLRIEKGAAVDKGHNNFRIMENSGGLSVRCYGQEVNATGWGTTYHLRFVDVPATVEVRKNGGEPAVIEVQRVSGRAVVVGLH